MHIELIVHALISIISRAMYLRAILAFKIFSGIFFFYQVFIAIGISKHIDFRPLLFWKSKALKNRETLNSSIHIVSKLIQSTIHSSVNTEKKF